MVHHTKNPSLTESYWDLRERHRRGEITRRDLLRWSAALGVSAPLVTTAINAAPAAAQQPGVFRVSYGPEVATLDKPSTGNQDAAYMAPQLFANMVRLDANAEIVPDFATHWEVSSDGKVYTFHLRKGVKWSDGSREITAPDVKYTWDRYFWPETASPFPGWGLEDVVGWQETKDGKTRDLAGAQPLDDYTFQVTLTQPSAIFLDLIAYPELGIVQRENVERGTEGAPWWREPVSSGPFVVELWTTGQELVLVPNPNYHGTKSSLANLVYRFIPDPSAMTLAYENGELDMMFASPADIRAAHEQGRFEGQLFHDEAMNFDFLVFKMAAPPVDDVHVRRALALAIDRELLNEAVLKGAYEAAKGWETTSAPWYNPDVDYLAFDPERARAEATQSSYGDPAQWPQLVFLVAGGASGAGNYNRLAVAMQAMWQEHLGINVEIKGAEDPWQAALQRQGQIMFFGVGNGYYDPHYVLDACALCDGWNNAWITGYQTESGEYVDGYCNPDLDKLIKAAKREQDPAKRLKMYQEAEQIFLLDAPMIPIVIGHAYFLVKPYVKGLYFLPVQQMYLELVKIEP